MNQEEEASWGRQAGSVPRDGGERRDGRWQSLLRGRGRGWVPLVTVQSSSVGRRVCVLRARHRLAVASAGASSVSGPREVWMLSVSLTPDTWGSQAQREGAPGKGWPWNARESVGGPRCKR